MSLAMKFNTVLTATRKQFESSKGKGKSVEYTNVHSTRAVIFIIREDEVLFLL